MPSPTLFPSFTHTLRSPHGRLLDLRQPQIMGILNLTPDSFYPGSRLSPSDETALLHRAEAMLTAGAAALDVGGYSSRPGADDITPAEELRRLLPAIEALRREFPAAFISVDTFRAAVAAEAVAAGADLVNDIGGGTLDDDMFATVARLGVPYCLMHLRGNPQTMRTLTHYDEDLVLTILRFFRDQLARLRQANGGHPPADVLLDPGFGFAKNAPQNFELLRRLPELAPLGHGLLVGLSRKAMVHKFLNLSPDAALNGTTALHAWALRGGARLLRVHDVPEVRQVVRLHEMVG
ncbi:dihydropteroate synthase [Hymenobacter sp. BT559]|uniref:dihydropteroate synthase n=1 Tax=Hymenobacter sp. BT559 TaxID=2795729 RepID=UPI0018ED26AB|nr:dihydropteroate synthase [Hymenobacter sp. BT559]MBJ6145818.1 dihydropteroate synthase [Hymenobacter sp. BT559]